MTNAEKQAAEEMLTRQKIGWAYLEQERQEMIRKTVTRDAILAFEGAFAYSRTLPPRLESGFTEFYRALSRSRSQ